MNYWILSSGLLCLVTSLVHILAGQLDPVRPFLRARLARTPKATLLACWHMVSAMLLSSSAVLIVASGKLQTQLNGIVIFISVNFIVFSCVFLMVGWHFFKFKTFTRLPQWTLLLPIGCFGIIGGMLN